MTVLDSKEEKENQNSSQSIVETRITSLDKYLQSIHPICNFARRKKGRVVFRGQPNKTFDLIPKLGRIPHGVLQKNPSIESDLFLKFKTQYPNYSDSKIDNKLDFLIVAQHYGLPTRLLDWTFDPLVALYFACQEDTRGRGTSHNGFKAIVTEEQAKNGKSDNDGAVFVRLMSGSNRFKDLEDDKSNEENFNPFEPGCDRMILPGFHDKRIFIQKGILELFKNPYSPSKLEVKRKIIIPAICKRRILRQLEDLHYSKLDLFPTLDNLSESIIKEMI